MYIINQIFWFNIQINEEVVESIGLNLLCELFYHPYNLFVIYNWVGKMGDTQEIISVQCDREIYLNSVSEKTYEY